MHYRKNRNGKNGSNARESPVRKITNKTNKNATTGQLKKGKTNKTNKNVPRGTLKKKGGAKHQPQSFPSKLNPPFLSHRERQPSQTYFDALRGLSHGHSRLAIYVALNRNSYIAGAGT
jgi:hypothetical protein